MDSTMRRAVEDFITVALDYVEVSKEAELAGRAAALRSLLMGNVKPMSSDRRVTPFTVSIHSIGNVHLRGVEALAAALKVSPNTATVRLSQHKGVWTFVRNNPKTGNDDVRLTVYRGEHVGAHSEEAEKYLSTIFPPLQGRPLKRALGTAAPPDNSREAIDKRLAAMPPGTNRFRAMRFPSIDGD